MGKRFGRKHRGISLKDHHHHHHLGCMWGLLHLLHYQRWRNANRILPQLRHVGKKRSAQSIENREPHLDNSISRTQQDVDNHMFISIVNQVQNKLTEAALPAKNSQKSSISAPTGGMFRWRGKHRQTTTIVEQSRETKNDPVPHSGTSEPNSPAEKASKDERQINTHAHRRDSTRSFSFDTALTSSDQTLNKIVNWKVCGEVLDFGHTHVDDVHPKEQLLDEILQAKLHMARETLVQQKLIDSEHHTRDTPLSQSKEFLCALDLVNSNKDLFQDILRDQGSPSAQNFHVQRGLRKKMSSTKFRSFLKADPCESGVPYPSKIQLKQKENATHLKEKEALTSNQVQRSEAIHSQLMSSGNDSLSSSILKDGSNYQVAVRNFHHLRQRERHRISRDAFLHKIPQGQLPEDVSEITDQWKETAASQVGRYSPLSSPYSSPILGRARSRHMRRTSSFDGSLDKYNVLYNSSFNRKHEHQISERSRWRMEEMDTQRTVQKYLGRILSSPELKLFNYFEGDDASVALTSGALYRTTLEQTNTDDGKFSDVSTDSENETMQPFVARETDAEGGPISSDIKSITMEDDVSRHDEDINSIRTLKAELAGPCSLRMPNSNLQEILSGPPKLSFMEEEGEKITLGQTHVVDLDQDALHFEVDTKDNAEFKYVKDVLELSGFCGSEILGSWNAVGQPLDLSVFEEVKDFFSNRLECATVDDEGVTTSHAILFDLINEVIKDIYEQSRSFYPKPLSSVCRIRPMPTGCNVLEEVWSSVSWYLSSRPDLDQSLDYSISRDLARGSGWMGWMNLQFDSECVGLELEESIFNDLLKEVVRDA